MNFDDIFGLLDLGLVVVTVLGFAVYELWSLRRARRCDAAADDVVRGRR